MMRKEEKQALLPKLRFPEFRETGVWEETKLGLNGAFTGGGTPSKGQANYWTGTNPWISSSDISDDNIQDISIRRFISDEAIQETATKLVPGNSILLVSRVGVGKLAITRKPICTSQDFTNFTPAKDNLVFLAYCLKSLKDTFLAFNQGMAIKGFTKDDVSNLKIPLPTQAEQQKIADCLASLDELITLEAQKLDTLKTHKKGLMQQLFPAEGETLPKLRFPEFRDAGEWKEKKIEDFFLVGSSKRVLQQDWTTQGVPFYRTRELVSLSKNEPFGSDIYISEELFSEISENYGLPAEGDFLVSGVGTLGISYQVQAQDRFYFKDGNVLWFKLKGGIVSTFFKYCFEADEIQNQIFGQASVSTVGTYTIQNAKVTKFSCPPNIEEQQKIADCLASLDDLITTQTQKLAALKTHKKGLMQQLFPVLDEVAA